MDDYSESRIESIKRLIEGLKEGIEIFTEYERSLRKKSEKIWSSGTLGISWKLKAWILYIHSIFISKKVERLEKPLSRLEFELEVLLSIEKITESTRPFDDE